MLARELETALSPEGPETFFGDKAYHDFVFSQRRCEILNFINSFSKRKNDFILFCEKKHIKTDPDLLSFITHLEFVAKGLVEDFSKFDNVTFENVVEFQSFVFEKYNRYRYFLSIKKFLCLALNWRSASYDQSRHPMFFDQESYKYTGMNYNRYESFHLRNLELQMREVLHFQEPDIDVIMTSSGMMAYQVYEHFLMRNVLKPGDKVYIPHYIYFEIQQQISSFKHIQVEFGNTHDPFEIVKKIGEIRPKVVFLDPLNNNLELRMTDIPAFLNELCACDLTDEIFVVIDGTTLSGLIHPFSYVTNPKVKVLYFESCSKYLQLGYDMCMAGVVAYPGEFKEAMQLIRRNSGAILYDDAVHVFPRFTRQEHTMRMRRMSDAALCIATQLNSNIHTQHLIKANFPWLEDHSDYNLASSLNSVGGLVTFSFQEKKMLERPVINAFIERILRNAGKAGLSIVQGASFGFYIPRLSASAAMAESEFPFMRLSVGDIEIEYAKKLADVISLSYYGVES